MARNFNPRSVDSMFTKVLDRLDEQDKTANEYRETQKQLLAEIRDEVKKTNGRVTALERWKESTVAKISGIALAVGFIGSAIFALLKWLL